MKERPILFSASMVRALLNGDKTQTRRIIKPHARDDAFVLLDHGDGWWPYRSEDGESANVDNMEYPFDCPYGKAGDRLWVRETHRPLWGQTCGLIAVDYRADPREKWERLGDQLGTPQKWTPSIHMRRDYSRILLEVISVRVERLQEISESDAMAEGVTATEDPHYFGVEGVHLGMNARESYANLWDTINGSGSVEANPWVWVVEFTRLQPS